MNNTIFVKIIETYNNYQNMKYLIIINILYFVTVLNFDYFKKYQKVKKYFTFLSIFIKIYEFFIKK